MDKVASVINPTFGQGLIGQNSISFFENLIQTLIGLGFVVGSVIFIFMLIIGGVQWITSGGDKGAIEAARSKLTNALVGVTILFGLFAALNLVNCFFGIGFDRVTIGPYQIQFSGVVCPNNGTPPVGGTPTPLPSGSCSQVYGSEYQCYSTDPSFPGSFTCPTGQGMQCLGQTTQQCDSLVSPYTGNCCTCVPADQLTCADVYGPEYLCFSTDPGAPGTFTCPPGQSMQCLDQSTLQCDGLVSPYAGNCCRCTSGTVPIGGACGTDSECVSNFCSSGTDIDNDNYDGSALMGTGTCQTGPGDCNDFNDLVFPGQSEYFQNAIAGQPGNFDYDCSDSNGDGDPNDKWPNMDCLTTLSGSSCQLTPFPDSLASQAGWVGSVPGCGQPFFSASPANFRTCRSWYVNNMCGGGADIFPGCNLSTFCHTGTSSAGSPYQSWNIGDSPVFPGQVPGYDTMPCK